MECVNVAPSTQSEDKFTEMAVFSETSQKRASDGEEQRINTPKEVWKRANLQAHVNGHLQRVLTHHASLVSSNRKPHLRLLEQKSLYKHPCQDTRVRKS